LPRQRPFNQRCLLFECFLCPSSSDRFRDNVAMLEGIQCPAHREDGIGLIFAALQLSGGMEHGRPLIVQEPHHSLPQIVRLDRVNQGMHSWSRHCGPVLAKDVALNPPVAFVASHVKAPFVDTRTRCGVWIVAPERVLWNVGAFQFHRPFQAAGRHASVHRFQSRDHLIWERVGRNSRMTSRSGNSYDAPNRLLRKGG
jgi:hypothetical protein